ncbi:hypothetical protein KEF29_28410 [Streptomyces tuirus]|uniref:Uncharacterized protein n=1 Tax=Streptomyces tuirus TaxID=68278 RepID=A0A941FDN9_9ACTN|nr:hypothetical protein [Streptomyces tuirus]
MTQSGVRENETRQGVRGEPGPDEAESAPRTPDGEGGTPDGGEGTPAGGGGSPESVKAHAADAADASDAPAPGVEKPATAPTPAKDTGPADRASAQPPAAATVTAGAVRAAPGDRGGC